MPAGRKGGEQAGLASVLARGEQSQARTPASACGGLQAGEATRREVSPWGTELQQVARMPGWVESREKQA